MRPPILVAALAALLLILGIAPARAESPAGAWALRSEGRTLALLTLRADPGSPGGWTADLARPDGMAISPAHQAFGMTGPVRHRTLRALAPSGDTLQFEYVDPATAEAGEIHTFRLIGKDLAEWGVKGGPIAPLLLARAGPGETPASAFDPNIPYVLDEPWPTNAEMTRLFDEDQAARSDPPHINWAVVGPQDAARREATRKLLDAGELTSGDDFWHAAFVFQHGDKPQDFLLAHVLAIVAAERGRRDAAWIAAATLDRYLETIGQKQVYGTQYSTPNDGHTTQEPYDRTLISDALRVATGVPPMALQEKRRAEIEAQYSAARAAH